jgi:hypothetical protein
MLPLAPFILPILYYSLKLPSICSIPTEPPHFRLIGNVISFCTDILLARQAGYVEVFFVNFVTMKVVFFSALKAQKLSVKVQKIREEFLYPSLSYFAKAISI